MIHRFDNPDLNQLFFSADVSLDGDKVLIGASSASNLDSQDGLVYLFDISGTLLEEFSNPTPAVFDLFGEQVSISGNRFIASGARDSSVANIAGTVYVYTATLVCGSGTIPAGLECVQDPVVTQEIADLQADLATAIADKNTALSDLAAAIAERDQALSDLATAQADLATAIADKNTALSDLAAAIARIAELEALLGEEDIFTLQECQKFQELADKRTQEGKDMPKGLQENLDTCAELFP